MKRKRLKKTLRDTLVVFAGILFFFTQVDKAFPAGSNNRSKPVVQKTQKAPPRRINRAAVSPSNFTPDMSFNEAINILRNATVPPLNIIVLWRNLETADVYRETTIGIDGVSGVPLRTHLKLLLMSLSAGATEQLRYVVNDGVIIISTQSTLPDNFRTRIYDITDLVAAPAGGGFMPGLGMPMGLGGMPFGGMMPFGLGGLLGGMMPFGGTGYTGQGQRSYGNTGLR